MSRRINHCGCGQGECWSCWKDKIENDYIKNGEKSYCSCGLDYCAVCNFYKKLEAKYPTLQNEKKEGGE